jgi:hypothetical protein
MEQGKIKVTEKEKEVLSNIVNSEFMNVTGEDMIGLPIWSWSATNRSRSLAGALGSLTKKKLVVSKTEKEGRTVFLTREGYDIAMTVAVSNAVTLNEKANVDAEAIEVEVEVVS